MRLNALLLTFLAICSASLATIASAHGSHQSLRGTVEAIETTRIVVVSEKGDPVDVSIGQTTRLRDQGGAPAGIQDLRVGDRVVVKVATVGGSRLAEEIRFAHPETPNRGR